MSVMTTIWNFLVAHQLVVAYVWCMFCNSWPSPKLDAGVFYQFFFKFISSAGANPPRGFSPNLPIAKAQARGVAEALAREKAIKSAVLPTAN
jgi:hypothetical protein